VQLELDAADDELVTSVPPLPQLASITVAAPPGQVTDSVPAVLSMPIVPTVVPAGFLIAIVIAVEVAERPPTTIV
jgi:hypothetical protein